MSIVFYIACHMTKTFDLRQNLVSASFMNTGPGHIISESMNMRNLHSMDYACGKHLVEFTVLKKK